MDRKKRRSLESSTRAMESDLYIAKLGNYAFRIQCKTTFFVQKNKACAENLLLIYIFEAPLI